LRPRRSPIAIAAAWTPVRCGAPAPAASISLDPLNVFLFFPQISSGEEW